LGGGGAGGGLSTEGHLRFKIDWASLIVRRKFTVFSLFCFIFEGNFQVQAPQGAYIWRGDLTEGFLGYQFGGLIFGGAYTWRGLFSEFYGIRSSFSVCTYSRNQWAHQFSSNVTEINNLQWSLWSCSRSVDLFLGPSTIKI